MPRRTQAERTATTRQLLIDATIASLVERGWAATTAVEVCGRAGVTRGALVHQFGSLPALLAAALEDLYGRLLGPPRPVTSVRGLVDRMWTATNRPELKAVIEAWLAAANDAELRDELGGVITGFAKVVHPDQVPGLLDDAEARAVYLTAREAILGLALGRACTGGQPLPHERTVLRRLRAQADAVDAAREAGR